MPLSQQRCFNHARREAVARCPGCKHFYCRECVTEHDHRLLCAACLAQQAQSQLPRRTSLAPILPVAQGVAAILILWCSFYLLGQGLLALPSAFHNTVYAPAPPADAP
ncbi:MAG: rhomboid family protein [Candidatus Hydrogenedentes bacterium]|nr:rhomboid family protein [Candidatus Hydrogenedentota bacterium]